MDPVARSEWVAIGRETHHYGLEPWMGPRHTGWLRERTRPHPVDPRLVLVPNRVYHVY